MRFSGCLDALTPSLDISTQKNPAQGVAAQKGAFLFSTDDPRRITHPFSENDSWCCHVYTSWLR